LECGGKRSATPLLGFALFSIFLGDAKSKTPSALRFAGVLQKRALQK
jgi:hypothetical protein